MSTPETFLAMTERHIREAEERIVAQEAIVSRLEADGHDRAAARAREILATFRRTLEVAYEHRRLELEEIAVFKPAERK